MTSATFLKFLLRAYESKVAICVEPSGPVCQKFGLLICVVKVSPLLDGVMPPGGRTVPMMGNKGIAHHPDVLAVVENPALFDFFAAYFGEPAQTFHYKWLRGVGNESYTGAHMDTVYMGRGSDRLHTVWIPFGDIPVEQGTLAMCVGSNRLDGFARVRATYGRMDVDRDGIEGWFSKDPMEIVEVFGATLLNVFTNWFNHITDTPIDFPLVEPGIEVAQGN